MNKNNNRLVLTLKIKDGIGVFKLKSGCIVDNMPILSLYATSQKDLISSVWVNLNNLNKNSSVVVGVNSKVVNKVGGCSKSRKDLNSNSFLSKLKRWFK